MCSSSLCWPSWSFGRKTCRSQSVKNETILFWTQGAIKSYLPTQPVHETKHNTLSHGAAPVANSIAIVVVVAGSPKLLPTHIRMQLPLWWRRRRRFGLGPYRRRNVGAISFLWSRTYNTYNCKIVQSDTGSYEKHQPKNDYIERLFCPGINGINKIKLTYKSYEITRSSIQLNRATFKVRNAFHFFTSCSSSIRAAQCIEYTLFPFVPCVWMLVAA